MANLDAMTQVEVRKALLQLQRECELRWHIMDAPGAPSDWSEEEVSFRALVISLAGPAREFEIQSFEPVLDLRGQDNTALKMLYLQTWEFWSRTMTASVDVVQRLLGEYRVKPAAGDGNN